MNKDDRLRENYEEALFAILMDKVAQEQGTQLLEENERLKDDPDAAVPPELDQKSLETIRRALSGRRRRTTHTAGWYLSRLAIAILAALFLFVIAYATVPDLRLRTLEMLIQNSDVSSRLSFAFGGNENATGTSERQKLAGYTLPDISESYAVVDQVETDYESWIEYAHANGATIQIKFNNASDTFYNIEEDDTTEPVNVHGYEGELLEKDGKVYLTWYDSENEKVILIITKGVSREMVLAYAEQIQFNG